MPNRTRFFIPLSQLVHFMPLGSLSCALQEVAATSDPYTQLVGAVVLPRLSMAITNDWEPRNPETLLQFMDAWEPHLPSPALQHILHSLILPKVRCHQHNPRPTKVT